MTTPMATGNTNAPVRRPHGPAGWLALAAAPPFAVMAWVSAGNDMALCSGSGALPIGGMTSMYLLMSLFHLPPWLKLASSHGASAYPFCNRTEGD